MARAQPYRLLVPTANSDARGESDARVRNRSARGIGTAHGATRGIRLIETLDEPDAI